MQIMECMTHFVEGLVLRHDQASALILGIFFKKWLDLPSTVQEKRRSIVILCVEAIRLVAINIILINKMLHFIFEYLNRMRIVNVMENMISIHPELFHRLRSNLCLQIFHMDYFVEINIVTVNTIFPSGKCLSLILPFNAIRLVVCAIVLGCLLG